MVSNIFKDIENIISMPRGLFYALCINSAGILIIVSKLNKPTLDIIIGMILISCSIYIPYYIKEDKK